jgi:hypothetical protein
LHRDSSYYEILAKEYVLNPTLGESKAAFARALDEIEQELVIPLKGTNRAFVCESTDFIFRKRNGFCESARRASRHLCRGRNFLASRRPFSENGRAFMRHNDLTKALKTNSLVKKMDHLV